MSHFESPFLAVPAGDWLCSNDLAFAIFDGFPVSPGHVLVTTRRIVETWFDATDEEQASLMALVKESKRLLDLQLSPKPDGYNVGFNSGGAAGQTVPHVHIHVIPRFLGDMPDPRGGVRHVIPDKGNYITGMPSKSGNHHSLTLAAGQPHSPLWKSIGQRVSSAVEVDLLASFIQPSGLDLIQLSIFSALRAGAKIRILVGDYLYITSAEALRRLVGWMSLADEILDNSSLEVRLAEISKLPSKPDSFHPKAWRIVDSSGGLLVVGSSNLSKAALETGVEWNLIGQTTGSEPIDLALAHAFTDLWQQATPLDDALVSSYALHAKEAHRKFIPPESVDLPAILYLPRPWQSGALESLDRIRADAYRRALVAVATGLGKTWLAAFDVLAAGKLLKRQPRVLIIAHRAEILIQAEATVRAAMQSEWDETRVTWYLGANNDMSGDLVVASVQKLTRPEGLAELDRQRFDYVVIDEVHHAQAPSYRRVMARLNATFTLGLTATPERTDGVDVASLFDDVLAWQATVGDGIAEGSLVPFHYLGLKDDVDFEQIPWRNGRFDPAALEEKLENSERMERLWSAWQADPEARTLVFCCSRRHALYTRDWLRRRQVRAAAVFSGSGGDPRSDSLTDFIDGKLQALCVVDLFNEGLDIPDVDRVVMLRPTESKVIFLQQLGRGLRAAENKLRLKVIDFVGNHRVFASRTAIGRADSSWNVLVNDTAADRNGDIYSRALTTSNTSAPVWQEVITKRDTGTPTSTGHLWYAAASVTPAYDFDGNLTNDGRWIYSWDAENRLIQIETTTAATDVGHPYVKVRYAYDWQGRRLARTVYKGTASSPVFSEGQRWLYDAWNPVIEFTATAETGGTLTRRNTYTWGLDLSGTLQGAGGVGGLLGLARLTINPVTYLATTDLYAPSFDGNGNIVAWTKSTNSAPTSRREYDAFGNTVVTEGTAPCSIGFSTKLQDNETGLYYYGYRWYDPVTGRWPSRDPIQENGGINLYGFIGNDGINWIDLLGLENSCCPQLRKALDRARLAQAGYPGLPVPDGWEKIDAFEKFGIPEQLFNRPKSGFNATMFYNRKTGEYVISFAGTNQVKDFTDANIPQNFALTSDQYATATRLGNVSGRAAENVDYVGHSLGGGLASAALANSSSKGKAYIYNAAGLNPKTLARYGGNYDAMSKMTEHWFHMSDPLTSLQARLGKNLMAPAAGDWNALLDKTNKKDPLYNHSIETLIKALEQELVNLKCQ